MSWHGADRSKTEAIDDGTRVRAGLRQWDVRTEPRMWDSPYATRTDWGLHFSWHGTDSLGWMDGEYHLNITLERVPQ